ncbi:Acyl-CoA synthetase (AMP-forming)/AMP-acid ligase II [Jannaschia faecimaris]|uniref:Acyl-CoA synthetase (AMP-forming)/AMP-acid ligase II n=1 Tax=Jannaschia faecimaris TaxID=1244108 RepID=A0A1H3TUY6_9RHOB|nr:AMP-binding protein [Jannaschia faecimaris]SDZ54016.1 Acyl-CoA synthetase (AMP-forming)/AMP-acid ligase II [Jannaschia faecimaris]
MRAQFGFGRGICRITAEPSVDFVSIYLAALQSGCPVVLEAQLDREDESKAGLPCLYELDRKSGRVVANEANKGHAFHTELKLLLSTSGSTGAKKFVRLSAENLTANSISIVQYLDIRPDDRAPTSLPLNYSYGLSILNSHLQAGASLLLIEEPVTSYALWEAFDKYACTSFSGVPQTFRILERSGQLFRERAALRYVTQAGGKLDAEEVKRWVAAGQRSGWDFLVMYGQTEASPRMSYLPANLSADNPSSIGVAIPNGKLWVSGPDEAPLPAGEEGELVYEGPNVMMGYATCIEDLAKPSGPQKLKTGDIGYFDEQGLFYITGRSARFLKLSGKRVSLDEVERWLRRQVVDCIAIGSDDALQILHTGERGVASSVAQWLSVPSPFIKELSVDTLPLNQNGKADLARAAELFEIHTSRQTPDGQQASDTGSGIDTIASIFRHQFPGSTVTADTTFDDLGGTSNDFVELEMALEEAGVAPFENWHLYPVSALSEKIPRHAITRSWLRPDHGAARALCCILVVLLHVVGGREGDGGLNLPAASNWHVLNDVLEPLRMPLFTFLSGYAFQVMKADGRTLRGHVSMLLNRLLAPTLFAISVFSIASNLVGTKFSLDTPVEFLSIFLFPYGVFWFVMALCLMTTVTYLIRRYFRGASAYILLGLAVALVIWQLNFQYNVWAINQSTKLMPFFIFGSFYASHADWLHARMGRIVALALTALVLSQLVEIGPSGSHGFSNFILSLSYIFLCVAFARHVPILSLIAPYTFFIYLWHVLAASGTRILWTGNFENVGLSIFAGTVAGVVLPILLFHVLAYLPFSAAYLRGK